MTEYRIVIMQGNEKYQQMCISIKQFLQCFLQIRKTSQWVSCRQYRSVLLVALNNY